MSASVQPFPTVGVLHENLNLTCSQLVKRIGELPGMACSYIVRTVHLDRATGLFEQHGTAPNFQGGYLTLCTCKHQMRSSLRLPDWQDKWVAGFTSRRRFQGRHWLFYLTRIVKAHESHADLWDSLRAPVREAKSAQEHFLGDLFRPQGKVTGEDRFRPRSYFAPSRHSHHRNTCDNGWHNDIRYKHTDRYGRPALLVGDPRLTFLWEKPMVFFDKDHCRNFKKWKSVLELLWNLEFERS